MLKFSQKIIYIINYLFSNSVNENKFLKSYFKNDIIFFDIGSNFGSEFDLIKKNLNIKKAFLIEPSKKCAEFLKNKYSDKNVKIINCAVSNRKETKLFYEYNILSQSSFYKLKKKHVLFKIKNSYKIQTLKLDSFFKKQKLKKIDLIKIDTQDHDLEVLKSAKNLLKDKKIGLIKVEVTFNSIYKSPSRGENIISYLNDMNYRLINVSSVKFENNKLMFFDAYFAK